MLGTPSELMRAANVAAAQGSFDQAQSICEVVLLSQPGDERAAAAARTLLESIVDERREGDRPLHVVLMGDSLSMPRPENAKTYDPRISPPGSLPRTSIHTRCYCVSPCNVDTRLATSRYR